MCMPRGVAPPDHRSSASAQRRARPSARNNSSITAYY